MIKAAVLVAALVFALNVQAQQPIGFGKITFLKRCTSESGIPAQLKCGGGDNSDCFYSFEDAFRAASNATTEIGALLRRLQIIAGYPIGYLSVSRREGAIQSIYITFTANGFRSAKEEHRGFQA